MKKQTFLILIGAASNGQLFHTVTAKSADNALELLFAYLTANGFENVSHDKDLDCVFCIGWVFGSLVSKQKIHPSQTFGYHYFNAEPATDWAI